MRRLIVASGCVLSMQMASACLLSMPHADAADGMLAPRATRNCPSCLAALERALAPFAEQSGAVGPRAPDDWEVLERRVRFITMRSTLLKLRLALKFWEVHPAMNAQASSRWLDDFERDLLREPSLPVRFAFIDELARPLAEFRLALERAQGHQEWRDEALSAWKQLYARYRLITRE